MRHCSCVLAACLVLCLFAGATAHAEGPVVSITGLATPKMQEDYPAMCLDKEGTPWVAYTEYDNKADRLKVATKTDKGLEVVGELAGPGLIHRPSIACDGKGDIWVVWSEFTDKRQWLLKARQVVDGKIQSEAVTLDGPGSAIFSNAGTCKKGHVWVAWQSFRDALGDIFVKNYDPATGKWSDEIQVTKDAAGDWEPQLAFADDGVWVIFDSSRGGDDEFNVYAAKVSPDGKVKITQLSDTPRYEGRPSVAATPDGKGLWVAWENGRLRWGKNARGIGGGAGLNNQKRIDVVYFDVATGKVTPAANVNPALKTKPGPKKPAVKKPPAKRPGRRQRPTGVQALNLPEIVVDAEGNPWVAVRSCNGTNWRIVLTKYDPKAKRWSQTATFDKSTFGEDRRCYAARGPNGRLWFAWPSDLRTGKRALVSGVYLAEVNPAKALPASQTGPGQPPSLKPPPVLWGDDTPERTRSDRHVWKPDGQEYKLYWGDFHRHTDISNCRTAHDGCIVEQFRYAYDVSKLDLLGTSDHTDVGKPYDPYEWWCNQKLADVFFVPGFFTSMYVYEREQRWPWGHRNVIFSLRGGPIVYIKRGLYKSMPWDKIYPVGDGPAEIHPEELWKILHEHDKPVTIISHTGATGMGTDWDGYKKIDNAVENLVEIYQGARVSYEGTNTPQPTVGFPKGKDLKPDAHGSVKIGQGFGKYNKGVYQNCLKNGWKLGVFANSDHISTHTSFGGVYVKDFTRDGILEGLNARRTIAGTDKIFIEFSCNGRLLGEIFETSEKPTMKIVVKGTAPLRAVTVVRNEANIQRFAPKNTKDLEVTFTDEEPVKGENRYYLRVEQIDGNMGWSSPVWVTYKKK